MIGRYPLSQGYIAEHRRLLLIVSAHALLIKQIQIKIRDPHQSCEFFRSLFSPAFSLRFLARLKPSPFKNYSRWQLEIQMRLP
jgi:hypothetical protein